MPGIPDRSWLDRIDARITYCDETGRILDLNEAAAAGFADSGGWDLLGRNTLDCHPEAARAKLAALLERPALNVYTIEKDGRRKLIYQVPVWEGETFRGIVELSLPLPEQIPHFIRS